MIKFNSIFWESVFEFKDSNSTAFCIADKTYSYKQLFDYVEQIYCEVQSIKENIICLYATDDIRTYASILALWLLGKSYVPLNPMQPKNRHSEIILSVGSHVIISSEIDYLSPIDDVEVINTNSYEHQNYIRKNVMNISDVSEDSLAYIIFTSGTTGKPKGVPITRSNLAHFIDSMNKLGIDITSDDKCLQPFDLTFDFSVSAYVIPLIHGASIYTVPNKAVKFTYIAGLLEEYKLTILQMVPSMIRNLLPYLEEIQMNSVRYNILCGEALLRNIIIPWHKKNPNMITFNMYGPTEDTVFCTYYRIDSRNVETLKCNNDVISIGTSFINTGVILLSEDNHIIKECNIAGELCLCGSQLMPGYWNNEQDNILKFINVNTVNYYRTGDMCYYNEDGDLMYLCRKDYQVKINGFRVELIEIEDCFTKISGGKFAVVIPYSNKQGNTELAIVVEGEECNINDYKSLITKELPMYEVPNKWFFISKIPLNNNGKVDRNELKKIFNL